MGSEETVEWRIEKVVTEIKKTGLTYGTDPVETV